MPELDFIPETYGRILDFLEGHDLRYETLRKRAEAERRSFRWSGRGKNMGYLGSFEPSRFDDTFVGNFRRAGVYKKIPARTLAAYEYWLDEKDGCLASFVYAPDDDWNERVGPYCQETFRAYADGELTIYVSFWNQPEGRKEISRVYGYRYRENTLAEKAVVECIGEKISVIHHQLFSCRADQTLQSVEEYRMESPAFYTHPLVRGAEEINRRFGLPDLPTLTYRDVVYRVLHWRTPRQKTAGARETDKPKDSTNNREAEISIT